MYNWYTGTECMAVVHWYWYTRTVRTNSGAILWYTCTYVRTYNVMSHVCTYVLPLVRTRADCMFVIAKAHTCALRTTCVLKGYMAALSKGKLVSVAVSTTIYYGSSRTELC
jgi:hypothetical protein